MIYYSTGKSLQLEKNNIEATENRYLYVHTMKHMDVIH